MQPLEQYLPTAVNTGGWLTRYTLDELQQRIVGRVRNDFDLDAALLFERMMNVAREDVRALRAD